MKYTFEITIAGCSTNCAHCYVNGGSAPTMTLKDFELCVRQLRPVLDQLSGDVSVTLGNEMFCHPQLVDILWICKEQLPQYVCFRDFIPTTGLALLFRKDIPAVLERLQTLGASGFMLALHGDRLKHDQVTQTRGAYDSLFHSADMLTANGFKLLWNLIVSRLLVQDIQLVLEKISPYNAPARLTVPLYVPTNRMRHYQPLRADYEACTKIAHIAKAYGISSASLIQHCTEHSAAAVLQNLTVQGFDYGKELQLAPKWTFFHITQKLDLYYGNVGAHTQYIGNLRYTPNDILSSTLASFRPNYDWNAFYDDSIWAHLCDILFPMCFGTNNLVYPSKADCLYALLDRSSIPNKLLPAMRK